MEIKFNLPLLPLRDIVVFPNMVIPLFVGRDKSINALNEVMKKEKKIILITQKNSEVDDPTKNDVFSYGCESNILQLLKLPDGTVKVLVEGINRVKITDYTDNKDFISEFSFLIQKEVAQRICSTSGNKTYGILSVLLQTYFDLEYLFEVSPDEFNPPPKVNSAVIRGVRNTRNDIGIPFKLFKNIVKTGFQNRRKTLRNSLKSLNLPETFTSNSIFSKRAEQLDVEDFIWLSSEINKNEP